jgi:PAS domain-containing protein
VALAFLLQNLLVARERGEMLSAQALAAQAIGGAPGSFARERRRHQQPPQQREVRYRGLVDDQGDAIFRCDAASRLTYDNTTFFRGCSVSIPPSWKMKIMFLMPFPS